MDSKKDMIRNITFDELVVGQKACLIRKLNEEDIYLFAMASGDMNPMHMNKDFADKNLFNGVIGHGMWLGGLISSILGNELPGPGTIYLEQNIKFKGPVHIGDEINLQLIIEELLPPRTVKIRCIGHNNKGKNILEGMATVLAPTEHIVIEKTMLPNLRFNYVNHHEMLIDSVKKVGIIKVAVVHPVDSYAIQAATEAAKESIIIPILIGPKYRIEQAAKICEIDISGWQIIDVEHSHAAAQKAVELAVSGEVDAIMKGALHTDELLRVVVRNSDLRTERRMSHAYLFTPNERATFSETNQFSNPSKALIISDAAINISPDLNIKADICRNVIDLFKALLKFLNLVESIDDELLERKPKIALLAAVETVTTSMTATLDAACLCKMAERGQIEGGILDGPLAFDNIISKQAAKDKGIISQVAGNADIIIVPNIETGNALAKELSFSGQYNSAGIVLGAKVPIILTSRADSVLTRLASCAVAAAVADHNKKKRKAND